MQRTVFNEDHEAFRKTIRDFIAKEVAPVHHDWEVQGHPPRDFYRRLGELGVLGIQVPEEYGGGGEKSFKFSAVVGEETAAAGVTFGSFSVHTNLILPYLLEYANDEQKQRWLPGFASGDIMFAIAMTEPGTGSDLANIATSAKLSEDGSHYVLNGAKTFITGGALADRILVVCRTAPSTQENRRAGLSILVVDTAAEGFAVGRKIEKIGLKASDTAELSFTDVKVPVEDRLGEEGAGFSYLTHNLAQERLTIALGASATAAAALQHALAYVKERNVFGKPVAAFQNTKFVLAECATEVEAIQLMADRALELHDAGELSVPDAAKVKLFCTEAAGRVIDKCLQLHGGYGYVLEYPIARLYADTRVSRIYGGTSEVMKTIIAKDLGL
ncbi:MULTISPECIES: acyl-CoA dehydrogenase family protein [Rhodococcus]|uniref:Acyl-CoA dehydrogenase family protein n=1 Tax=Rhodococcus oxybenzonivorans TaxID=1990687 RepID=A0AAE5A874_9NOCA|nr:MULTISPECIES: acyl-CoA dehydrogenase family protein [Rhodococcus]MDV7246204.1 acyl-CoA dehydrogenase family protein [Rhodococcus oxybenzonivorans]MDV7267291.1 acyl-CoA dehydrogenase family protein [Rhodococcus oxybenzonivorans]MDV7277919.1 acyl-CoA dehydrogenase family protein [Rhodococcus oxybenzonivorans]MDV7337217.1 acyl-CoA dehydrogenase family protein [Rhodococcus oxybenzonivorans]MDV7347430.1 acyl-CoA dehydrogenase family protein [Rhodococcus oxybenzonivorans]